MRWKGIVGVAVALAVMSMAHGVEAKKKGGGATPQPQTFGEPAAAPATSYAPAPVTKSATIAPEPYGDVVEKPDEKPTTGYNGGFFVQTKDGEFKLKMNARMHFQYKYENLEGVSKSTFMVRRALLAFKGTIYDRFTVSTKIQSGTNNGFSYVAGPTLADTSSETRLVTYWETYGAVDIIPEFNITLGDVYLPFDLQGEGSSTAMFMCEQPITATQRDANYSQTIARNAFGTDEDTGIVLSGNIGKFGYAVAGVNGSGPHSYNINRKFDWGGRIYVDVLEPMDMGEPDLAYSEKPRLLISAGTVWQDEDAVDPNTGLPISWNWSSSGGVQFKWKGFAMIAEAYYRRLKIGAAVPYKLDDFGYYAQAGYFVWPKKFEIVARGAQIFREGPENNSHEYGGGLNYYIHGYNAKVQLDYSRVLDFALSSPASGAWYTNHHRVRAMFQINI